MKEAASFCSFVESEPDPEEGHVLCYNQGAAAVAIGLMASTFNGL